MSLALNLQLALKDELRKQRITYASVAEKLALSEATIKRDFSRNTLSLERFGAICDAFDIALDALTQNISDKSELVSELTHAQEREIVGHPRLWLVAVCALNQWTHDEIAKRYEMSVSEVTQHLLALDKMGILELHAENRIRLKLARNFRWRPDGAFIQTFRQGMAKEFFSGTFNDEPDTLRIVIGSLSSASLTLVRERLLSLASELTALHARDSRLPSAERKNVTLALALRDWEPQLFREMKTKG